jgi:predicted O-methyltransferase YrrM
MAFEFETVWPFLRKGGILIADDVGMNDAFSDFAMNVKPAFAAVIKKEKDRDALFGIMVKQA